MRQENGCDIWCLRHDSGSVSRLSVIMTQKNHADSDLRIEDISFDGDQLHHLDQFGVYLHSGQRHRTYGYMNQPGEYRFKIRFAPMLHRFIMYLSSEQ